MRLLLALPLLLMLAGCGLEQPRAAAWSGCQGYPTQSQAQQAWEGAGRPPGSDGDGDGRVCESLPARTGARRPGGSGGGRALTRGCRRQNTPRVVLLSRARYPETSLHIEKAIDMGQPALMHLDRAHTDRNRDAWHRVVARQQGLRERRLDQDEWPMAFTREGGRNANIALVDASDNRGAGSSIASQLRGWCDGQAFRVKAYGRRQRVVRILIIADRGRRVSVEAGG